MKKLDLQELKNKPLEPVLRVVYCGNCKGTWRMKGYIRISGHRMMRTFPCPYCRKIAKRDYFTDPTTRAIETERYYEPLIWRYNDEFKQMNKALLNET